MKPHNWLSRKPPELLGPQPEITITRLNKEEEEKRKPERGPVYQFHNGHSVVRGHRFELLLVASIPRIIQFLRELQPLCSEKTELVSGIGQIQHE